jgi:MFS transporter, MCT family, solute carrier family 16 (monocarboxylic acid transporters), member 10
LAFCIYTLAAVTAFLGIYTVLTYIATCATERGISQSMAYNLVAITSASSLIGRVIIGFLADQFGPLNVMVPLTLLAGILTYGERLL